MGEYGDDTMGFGDLRDLQKWMPCYQGKMARTGKWKVGGCVTLLSNAFLSEFRHTTRQSSGLPSSSGSGTPTWLHEQEWGKHLGSVLPTRRLNGFFVGVGLYVHGRM